MKRYLFSFLKKSFELYYVFRTSSFLEVRHFPLILLEFMRDLNILLSAPPPKPPYLVSLEQDSEEFEDNMQENAEIIEEAKIKK